MAISHFARAESSAIGLFSSRFFSSLFWIIAPVLSSTPFKKLTPLATLCRASVLNCSISKIGADCCCSASSGWREAFSGMPGVSTGNASGSSLVSDSASGAAERLTSGTFLNRSSASEPLSSAISGVSNTSSGHSISCGSDSSGSTDSASTT